MRDYQKFVSDVENIAKKNRVVWDEDGGEPDGYKLWNRGTHKENG